VYRCTTTAFCSFAASTVSLESPSSRLGKVVCRTNDRASDRALLQISTLGQSNQANVRRDIAPQISDRVSEVDSRDHPIPISLTRARVDHPPRPITQTQLHTRRRLILIHLKFRLPTRALPLCTGRPTVQYPLRPHSTRHRRGTTPRPGDLRCRRSQSITRSLERLRRLLRRWAIFLRRPLRHLQLQRLIVPHIEKVGRGATRLDRLEEFLVAWRIVSHERSVFDRETVPPEDEVAGLDVFLVFGWGCGLATESAEEGGEVAALRRWASGRGAWESGRIGDRGGGGLIGAKGVAGTAKGVAGGSWSGAGGVRAVATWVSGRNSGIDDACLAA